MLLRLTQHNDEKEENRHRVEVRLEEDGRAPCTAESRFEFGLGPQDEEDLRWYLEDFLQYPQEPAPTIARRIEGRLAEVGKELFRAVFHSSDETRDLWAQVRDRIAGARVEVVTGVAAAVTLPWELLRDPRTDYPLALTARSFVRSQPRAPIRAWLPAGDEGPVRILVALCRPGGTLGEVDAPFRSVASRLIKGLSASNRNAFDLDLLRPPTFEQLGRALRQARGEGRPYHMVHFDGHGLYGTPGGLPQLVQGLSADQLSGGAGKHGYLAFENSNLDRNLELVGGPALGRLLHENGVVLLVLNACRSAHSEVPERPAAAVGEDHHSQVRAFGSLAQEVMEAGVAGVVAMRYNIYVVTAAQLVGELYASLCQGQTLGEAATLARKNLADRPLREIASEPRPLQDWLVPVVYEAAPLRIFPRAREEDGIRFHVSAAAASAGNPAALLPPPPDVGFYGRDETLLALDRAFDRDRVVLLHAYAGSGKTTAAVEFARWYTQTGGVEGPVIFTSFERYLPLQRALDDFEQEFSSHLERGGVQWLALDATQRRDVALQMMKQVPVFWIWDNVELIAGFPTGTPSTWSDQEQKDLASFLRALNGTKAKVLLTSRRAENQWLKGLPTRIEIPPMPMLERLQLARAIAEKHGRKLARVDWRPLLEFSERNPLALTVLVGQVIREQLTSKQQIEAFVNRLRSGEIEFEKDASEGRATSLGASLAYGFGQAFSDDERQQLALLSLFQSFVQASVLQLMGHPDYDWHLPEVRDLGREEWIDRLDRAAEVGLLTSYGGGNYGIHPALPWFFQGIFKRFYPAGGTSELRAYVEAVGKLGNFYFWQYEEGNRDIIAVLRAEEMNLLHARHLALEHEWWEPLISIMQGLRQFYGHTGRWAEFKWLVNQIVPSFIDPQSGGPFRGREELWSTVLDYQVLLAEQERNWAEAERLQGPQVDWARSRAAQALRLEPERLDSDERLRVRSLAVSLGQLGTIRRELRRANCIATYEEALALGTRIGDRGHAKVCALNLGRAYTELSALRDLDRAEWWFQRSLELHEEHDRLGRGICLAQLGYVEVARLADAESTDRPEVEIAAHRHKATGYYHAALDLFSPDAVAQMATAHNSLGELYRRNGSMKEALNHYRRAIYLDEAQGDHYSAARTRFNMARALFASGRQEDALEYAKSALLAFQLLGEKALAETERTRRLIENIQEE